MFARWNTSVTLLESAKGFSTVVADVSVTERPSVAGRAVARAARSVTAATSCTAFVVPNVWVSENPIMLFLEAVVSFWIAFTSVKSSKVNASLNALTNDPVREKLSSITGASNSPLPTVRESLSTVPNDSVNPLS